jgi:hypothetical protein
MKKLTTLFVSVIMLMNFSIAQSSFNWSPNDTIIQDVNPDLYTEMDIHQINLSGDTLELGIEVVYNDIPVTWDGMICIQGLCLGSIQPVGFIAQMIPIYDTIYGYTKLTVYPAGGTESGKLRIRVYDKNNPTDGDTCTWIVNSVAATAVKEISGNELSIYPNPASGFIQVSSEKPFDEIRIMDFQGRRVKQRKFESTKEITVGLEDLPSGVFFIETLEKGEIIKQLKLITHD